MALEQSVLGRTVLSTAGMAVQGLVRFAYTIAIGRLAGPAALADTSALLSVSVYLALLLPAGLGITASRYLPDPAMAGAALRLLRRWFHISSLVLAIGAVPLSYLIVHSLPAALSCGALVYAYNAYVFSRGVLMGEDRILRSAVADLVSSLVAITALVAVLLWGAHWALLLPIALGYLLFAFTARATTTPADAVAADTRSTIARFLRDASIGALATGGLLPATMIFVRAFDTPEHAGLFAAALSLATPANLVAQAVNQVLIPHFARLGGDDAALVTSHRKLLLATTALFAAVFGTIILLSPWILSLFYGKDFSDGATAMQVLLGIVFLISTTSASAAFLVACGRQRSFATIWVVALILGTGIMVLASPALGMLGALLGFAVGGGGGSLAIIAVALAVRKDSLARP